MRFRFPYPALLVLSLLAVVLFAGGYSLATQREVAAAPGATQAQPYVLGMYGFTVLLAMFVGAVLLYRSRLVLELGERALVLHRLHWRRAARRVEVPYAQLERALVRSDARGIWHLWLERGMDSWRLPLMHAVVEGERRPDRLRDADTAAAHPLVAALRERLGERLVIDG